MLSIRENLFCMVKDTAGYHSGLVTPSTGNGALLKMFLINRDSSVEHLDASQTRHYCTDKNLRYKGCFKGHKHIRRKLPKVEFDFNVRFSTLMQSLTSKMDKLGSRRRPTLS